MPRFGSVVFFFMLLLLGCVSRKHTEHAITASASGKTGDTAVPVVMPGGDADNKGCRKSAGYIWSAIKNECIRPWETGIRFLKTKEGLTTAAYLVLADDGKTAELFCAELKTPALMIRSEKSGNSKGQRIYEDMNSCWALIKDSNIYSLNCGSEKIYRLPDTAAAAKSRFTALKQ